MSPDALPATADAVVIGAGAAGLVAALGLLRKGLRPVLLEGDGRVGGTAGSFVRQGFRFPTGPLGFTVPGEIALILDDVDGPPLPPLVREHFGLLIEDDYLRISVPLVELAAGLAGRYPADREGIRRFAAMLADIMDRLRILRRRAPGETESALDEGALRPAGDVLGELVTSPRARSVLGSQGSGEPVMPMGLLASMWDFLAETGIWYPTGGGTWVLMEALARAFRDGGGFMALSTPARTIRVEEGRVRGVEASGGRFVAAPAVVAAMDTGLVVRDLLPRGVVPEEFRRSLLMRPLSGSVLSVSLGIETDRVDFSRMREPNLLWTRREGAPVPWQKRRGEAEEFSCDEVWISRLGVLDQTLAPEGHEALVIRVDAPYGCFERVRRSPRPHEDGYYDLKDRLGRALVRHVAGGILPGLETAVRVMDVATPLTYESWGHRRLGSVAGWSWRAGKEANHAITAPVRGLHFAGILSFPRLWLGGMGSAMRSGLEAARALLREQGMSRDEKRPFRDG